MSTVTLTLAELVAIALGAAFLAVTDGARFSRVGIAYLAKKLGVRPGEIEATNDAADGQDDGSET